MCIAYGILAQLGEHLPYKQRVIGSSPIGPIYIIAGWSSLVARRAHNPKVVGSNPSPATQEPLGFLFFLYICNLVSNSLIYIFAT